MQKKFKIGEDMCKIMEGMRSETKNETLREAAKRMIADGKLTLEKIAKHAGPSLAGVKELQADKNS